MPSSPWPFLDHPGILAFAHRGGAGAGDENTAAAFTRSIDLGYRYLETDARLTADGVLVAFHDDSLDRVTDRTGHISDLPWSEVARAKVKGESILRLEDVLGSWPDVRINIDPKQDSAVAPLAEILHRTASVDRVCVGGFSDRRLAMVRRLVGSRLCMSLGPAGLARLKAAGRGLPVGRLPGACAQLPVRAGPVVLTEPRLIEAAHRRGLQVHVWTVDEPAEMHRLLDLGVDGLMTDQPTVLKEVLVTRGQWA